MPLKIIIAGAGIAGLAAAIGLARHGHQVTVFERREHENREESGSGIQLQPNAIKILRSWGMEEDILKVSHNNEAAEMRRYDTAETIVVDRSITKGGAYIGLRRDLRDVFRTYAVKYGAVLEDGKRVTKVDSSGPLVFLEDGSMFKAQLVIGADGSFSKVRHSLFPAYRAQIQPHCFYQIVLPLDDIVSDPATSPLLNGPMSMVWCAPGRHIFSSPIFSRREYDMQFCDMQASLKLDPEPEVRSGRMTDMDSVRMKFADHHISVRKALEKADSYWKWRLFEVADVPSWSSPNGKVILIGDAVHSMRPYSGQGSAMGIEDGFVLGELLARSDPDEDLRKIAQLYEQLRRPRCEKIYQLAIAQGKAWSNSSPQQQRRRDTVVQANANPDYDSIQPDSQAPFSSAAFRKWLNHYDAAEEIRKAIEMSGSARAKI